MSFRDYLTPSTWFGRALAGPTARRIYLAAALFLLFATTVARVYSFILVRRIQAVISGLSKLRIDETADGDVLRTVPYLVRGQDWTIEKNVELGDVEPGLDRSYYATISNKPNWMMFETTAWRFSSAASTEDGHQEGWLFKAADLLGYRYVGFGALVVLHNGRVSSISYGIADRLVFPEVLGDIISFKSAHARWAVRQTGFEVPSTEDESPQFSVSGDSGHLGVWFTPEASPELRSHLFQVNLSCFWSLLGCRHARDVAPLLWQDKNAIEAATLSRLQSNDPCPDRILAGRIKYLPDIDVVLLESSGSRLEGISEEGSPISEARTHYKLVEVLRGHASGSWESVRSMDTVLYPGDYTRRLPNRGLQWTKAGEKVLAFSNLNFDSCRMIRATHSALSKVRDTNPAPRRGEDELAGAPL
jgi:hypothetical protein